MAAECKSLKNKLSIVFEIFKLFGIEVCWGHLQVMAIVDIVLPLPTISVIAPTAAISPYPIPR